MQITYLGHAGFLVETEQAIVVMDPWMSPEGAFDSAWFQFPRNHDLAPYVREKLGDTRKDRFVYISHEHHDHFDPHFLASLSAGDLTFLVPNFTRAALRTELARLQPAARVVTCNHGELVPIPGGYVKLYLDDSGLNRDSGVLLKSEGQAFLNLNDCKLYDEVASIAEAEGPIGVFTCQFSGATWHPTCYEYDPAAYTRISQHKLLGKFEMVARAIEAIQPRVYLPSAGPACFLDPSLLHINFQPANIFPRAPQFFEFLRQRLPASATELAEIMPGDLLCARTGHWQPRGTERVREVDFETYIRGYADRYRKFFDESQPKPTAENVELILEKLQTALEQKLSTFTLHDRIRVPLYFGLSDVESTFLRIDFASRGVERANGIVESDYYSLVTPSWQISRVLDGAITWEQFALTFRVRLNRKPDVYQTLMQGFLLMEPEDMNWFCARLLEIEQRQKRIIIEAGGMRYSIDRYCPHQGADLSQGWLADGRFWTCPRHRWQFALDKEGQCLTSNGTINAICLEND
jgi:UDP-MurNAc hydroxylase